MPTAEKYFTPKTTRWGRYIGVLCCTKCAQVIATALFSPAPDDGTITIHRDEGEDGPCPQCGNWTVAKRGSTGSVLQHVTDGVARFRSLRVWWKPWTWHDGYWQLSDETQEKIAPLTPLERLAQVEFTDEEE